MEKDIVCGMEVDEGSDCNSLVNGRIFYFCSEECKNKFDKNPIKYIR
jgi:YHS domain-containing protein